MLRASPSVACTGRCRPVHVHVQLLNDRMSKATTSADSRCRATGRPADSEAAPTSDRLPHDVASTSSAARLPPNPSLVTSGYGYTLSSMYVPKAEKPVFKDLDHLTRRRERDIKEICEAAVRLGLSDSTVRENIKSIEQLLPDLQPNMDRMRASEWAELVSDVNRIASMLIVLKTEYPSANISKIVAKTPRTLLQTVEEVQRDASEVKALLSSVDGQGELDGIVEAVPYLLSPRELRQSLKALKTWFPSQDPVETLRGNPSLLLNVGEADIEADPLYGDEVGNLH